MFVKHKDYFSFEIAAILILTSISLIIGLFIGLSHIRADLNLQTLQNGYITSTTSSTTGNTGMYINLTFKYMNSLMYVHVYIAIMK